VCHGQNAQLAQKRNPAPDYDTDKRVDKFIAEFQFNEDLDFSVEERIMERDSAILKPNRPLILWAFVHTTFLDDFAA
jgi:hypothetical protein